LLLTATTPNINNNIRVEWTYANFIAPVSINSADFKDKK